MIRHKILLPFWNTKKLYIIIITVIYNYNDDNMEFLCENDFYNLINSAVLWNAACQDTKIVSHRKLC